MAMGNPSIYIYEFVLAVGDCSVLLRKSYIDFVIYISFVETKYSIQYLL